MPDDVLQNKCETIERCIARIIEEYNGEASNLYKNLTRQDSILLNLQRACEAAIGLAMHVVRIERLGIPQESRDAFSLLVKGGELPAQVGEKMMKMVGFRNVAVHDYRDLNLDIVHKIITGHLEDFMAFTKWALTRRVE